MKTDDAVAIGIGTLATCVAISGIAWYTLFRFIRWMVM